VGRGFGYKAHSSDKEKNERREGERKGKVLRVQVDSTAGEEWKGPI